MREHIALVFDGAGNQTHRYFHGPQVDQVLAQETAAGETHWALGDHQGSVLDVVDNDATVLNHITYDSFGQVTSESDPTFDFRFGYTGRELDAESGLMQYRARYYDPAVGRFLSEDPLGFDAGDSNVYRYVFNGPTNYSDPSGELAISVGVLGAAALGGIVLPIIADAVFPDGVQAPMNCMDFVPNLDNSHRRAWFEFVLSLGTDAVLDPRFWRSLGNLADSGIRALGRAGDNLIGPGLVPVPVGGSLGVADDIPLSSGLGNRGWLPPGRATAGGAGAGSANLLPNPAEPLLSSGSPQDAVPEIEVIRMPDDRLIAAPKERGRPPIGDDNKPIELHHQNQNPDGPLIEMTRTEHRGKGNFKQNHSNTGQSPSAIDRGIYDRQRTRHWERDYDSGRFQKLPPQ